ncbi:MAG TPA: hypothetical protein VJY62_06940 [Bacteroidia bacterium]|nr:hypothetical protein [Bacteroidia bacterium]
MKKYVIIIFLLQGFCVYAQNDTKVSLDQLQTPSSPAFNLLGIDPENIERPKNPTDFSLSLNNATQDFTTIPKSYAIEFAPYWTFDGRNSTFKDYISNKMGSNILQSLTISAGTTTKTSEIDSSEFYQIGFAVKFSIFRGNVTDDFKSWNDSATYYLGENAADHSRIYDRLKDADPLYNTLKALLIKAIKDSLPSDELNTMLNKRVEELGDQATKIQKDSSKYNFKRINELAGQTDFKRTGWKLDAAIGTVMDYPENTFQTCYVTKVGGWLTGGYESEKSINGLGVLRVMDNIYQKYVNDSAEIVNDIRIASWDWGVRVYKDITSKLTLSFEHITRVPISNNKKLDDNYISHPKVSSRDVFSINYKVGKNQNVSFTYGKDFDNIKIKEGNLVAALSFALGFGSSRAFGQ